MRVVALKPGYYGDLRTVGELFEVADDAKASWFAPVDAEQEEPEQEEPEQVEPGQEKPAAHKSKSGRKKTATADDLV